MTYITLIVLTIVAISFAFGLYVIYVELVHNPRAIARTEAHAKLLYRNDLKRMLRAERAQRRRITRLILSLNDDMASKYGSAYLLLSDARERECQRLAQCNKRIQALMTEFADNHCPNAL